MKNISIFYLKIFILFGGKFLVYLYRRVFVMKISQSQSLYRFQTVSLSLYGRNLGYYVTVTHMFYRTSMLRFKAYKIPLKPVL